MHPDNEKILVETFPKLYRQYYLSMQETCMCWGFQCSDSWYHIIYELSEKIDTFMKENNFLVEATQVKNKYGGLRFYADYVGPVSEKNINIINGFITDAKKKVSFYELARSTRFKDIICSRWRMWWEDKEKTHEM